jgi:lipopolysaccharide/colanic/teichoic acid biosynthesis glycosyltransferase
MSELLSLAVTAVENEDFAETRPFLRVVDEITVVRPVPLRKRAVDLIVCTLGFLAFAIPMLIIAALVKCTSRGPVLFTQPRVGADGILFPVKKFRTMRDGTHAEVLSDHSLHALYRANDFKLPSGDPRITTVGRFLRKTSLDELPQLFNVLTGDMSIVGVRPLVPAEVAQRPMHDQLLYRSMQPGMTGLWQIEGRSTVRDADRLLLDRDYLEQWTLRRDLAIIARTPFAVLRVHHTQ